MDTITGLLKNNFQTSQNYKHNNNIALEIQEPLLVDPLVSPQASNSIPRLLGRKRKIKISPLLLMGSGASY